MRIFVGAAYARLLQGALATGDFYVRDPRLGCWVPFTLVYTRDVASPVTTAVTATALSSPTMFATSVAAAALTTTTFRRPHHQHLPRRHRPHHRRHR